MVGEYFQSPEADTIFYMRQKYGIKVFNSNSFANTDSVTARIHNNFIDGINKNLIFPKAIVIILDSDLIRSITFDDYGVSDIYSQALKNLMNGIHREILSTKENLPERSLKSEYPTVLWSLVPLHARFPGKWNNKRRKLNNCLENLVKQFPEMKTLKLKKFWEIDDPELFDTKNRKYTALGLQLYWKSIDSAFHHWDTFIAGKTQRQIQTDQLNPPKLHNKFKFVNKDRRLSSDFVQRQAEDYKLKKKRRRLPTPPNN